MSVNWPVGELGVGELSVGEQSATQPKYVLAMDFHSLETENVDARD